MLIKWNIAFQCCLFAGFWVCIKKAIYQPPLEDRLFNYFWYIIRLDPKIVNSLWVYDHKCTLFAKARASGFLDLYLVFQTSYIHFFLKGADDQSSPKTYAARASANCDQRLHWISFGHDF